MTKESRRYAACSEEWEFVFMNQEAPVRKDWRLYRSAFYGARFLIQALDRAGRRGYDTVQSAFHDTMLLSYMAAMRDGRSSREDVWETRSSQVNNP